MQPLKQHRLPGGQEELTWKRSDLSKKILKPIKTRKKDFKAIQEMKDSPRHWDTPHRGGHQGGEVRSAEKKWISVKTSLSLWAF